MAIFNNNVSNEDDEIVVKRPTAPTVASDTEDEIVVPRTPPTSLDDEEIVVRPAPETVYQGVKQRAAVEEQMAMLQNQQTMDQQRQKVTYENDPANMPSDRLAKELPPAKTFQEKVMRDAMIEKRKFEEKTLTKKILESARKAATGPIETAFQVAQNYPPFQNLGSVIERNKEVLGKTLEETQKDVFERPGSAVRSYIRGTGYEKGAINPEQIQKFQDEWLQKANEFENENIPNVALISGTEIALPLIFGSIGGEALKQITNNDDKETVARFLLNTPASTLSLTADLVTNPADILLTILGDRALKYIGKIPLGSRTLGERATGEVSQFFKPKEVVPPVEPPVAPAVTTTAEEAVRPEVKIDVPDEVRVAQERQAAKGMKRKAQTISYLEEKIYNGEKLPTNVPQEWIAEAEQRVLRRLDVEEQTTGLRNRQQQIKSTLKREPFLQEAEQAVTTTGEEAVRPEIKIEVPKEKIQTNVETPAQTEYSGNINLQKMNLSEPEKQIIRETDINAPDLVKKYTRGVVTQEKTRSLAQKLGLTEKELLKRRAGQAYNSEELYAAETLLDKSARETKALGDKFKLDPSEENLDAFQEQILKHANIQAQVEGVKAEPGRALNIQKVMVNAERQAEAKAKMVLNKEMKQKSLDELIKKATNIGKAGFAGKGKGKPIFSDPEIRAAQEEIAKRTGKSVTRVVAEEALMKAAGEGKPIDFSKTYVFERMSGKDFEMPVSSDFVSIKSEFYNRSKSEIISSWKKRLGEDMPSVSNNGDLILYKGGGTKQLKELQYLSASKQEAGRYGDVREFHVDPRDVSYSAEENSFIFEPSDINKKISSSVKGVARTGTDVVNGWKSLPSYKKISSDVESGFIFDGGGVNSPKLYHDSAAKELGFKNSIDAMDSGLIRVSDMGDEINYQLSKYNRDGLKIIESDLRKRRPTSDTEIYIELSDGSSGNFTYSDFKKHESSISRLISDGYLSLPFQNKSISTPTGEGKVTSFKDVTPEVKKISTQIPQSRGAGEIPTKKTIPVEEIDSATKELDSFITQNPDKFTTQKGTPIVMNADYGMSYTPDPSCAKGKVLRNQTISMRKALKDAGLPAEVRTAAARKLFESGLKQKLETPCIMCYEYEKQLTGYQAKPATYGSKVYKPGSIDKHVPELKKSGIIRGYGVGDMKGTDIPSLINLGKDLNKHGLGFGTYTKNLNFVEIFGDTGFKFNISTGSNPHIGLPVDVVAKYRERYWPNVASNYVAINEADLIAAGKNPNVDKIIPTHLGGGTPSKFLSNATGLEVKNFQSTQSEKVMGVVLHSNKLEQYVDPKKLAQVRDLITRSKYKGDVEEYKAAIKEGSKILGHEISPMFKEYADEPWYHKLIGTGGSEYGVTTDIPIPDMSKVNFEKAKSYMQQPDIDSAVLEERYGTIANKIIDAAKRGGVEAIQKIDPMYLSSIEVSGKSTPELIKISLKRLKNVKGSVGNLGESDPEVLNAQMELVRRAGKGGVEALVKMGLSRIDAERVFAAGTAAMQEGETHTAKRIYKALGDREITAEIAKRVSQLDMKDPVAIHKFIRDASKAKTSDQIFFYFITSILSAPLTHVVNSTSNFVRSAANPIYRAAGAAIESPKRLVGKTPEIYAGEPVMEVLGKIKGISEGARKFIFTMRHGISEEAATKFDTRPTPIPGKLGEIVSLPTRALSAEDDFFKSINSMGEIYALAYRNAAKTAPKGRFWQTFGELVKNPTEGMVELATKAAERQTFQEKLGSFGQKLMQARNVPGARYVFPFVKTPTNIFKDAARMTPAGIGMAFGEETAAQRSMTMGQAVVGTAGALWMATKAVEGKLTGAAPKDPTAKAKFYAEGKLPYAIKIGNKWIQYSRIEPFASVLGLIGDGYRIYNEKNLSDATNSEIALEAGKLVAKNVQNKTWMKALTDLQNAVDEPEKYAERFITGYIKAAVPFSGAVRTVANVMDDTLRQPKTIVENIKSGLPGLSQEVRPRLDQFGEPIQKTSSKLARAISPIQASSESTDPLISELRRLNIEVPIMSNRQSNIRLTEDEYFNLREVHGKKLRTVLDRVIQSNEYQRLNDYQKENYLTKTMEKSKEYTREKTQAGFAPQKRVYLELLDKMNQLPTREEKRDFIINLKKENKAPLSVLKGLAKRINK